MPDFDSEAVTPPIPPVRDLGVPQRFTVFMDPKGNLDYLELVYDAFSSGDSDLESMQVVLRRFSDAKVVIQPIEAILKAIVKAWMAAGVDEARPE